MANDCILVAQSKRERSMTNKGWTTGLCFIANRAFSPIDQKTPGRAPNLRVNEFHEI